MKKTETEFGIEPESVNWQLPYMLKCHEYKNKFVFVVHNYECAYMAAINNSVVYITDDKEKYNKFVDNVVNSIQFGNDDYALLIKSNQWLDLYDIINNFLKEENMPKFDVAIMNPPYDGSLHLKILEKVIPIADKVVNISPIRWLQDPLAKYKKRSDYKKFEDTISKKIKELDIIDAVKACNLFNAEMSIDLGIYTINNTGGFDYNKFSSNKLIDIFYNNNKFPVFDEMQQMGWRVRIPYITSGGGGHNKIKTRSLGKLLYFYNGKKDNKFWYEFYNRNQFTKISSEIPRSILFNTENECKNFINSLSTKIGSYFMQKILVDVNVHPETILWVEDYTQPWTDKRFCEYFGITGYIDDDHAEPNSEWETILNTMKEYK